MVNNKALIWSGVFLVFQAFSPPLFSLSLGNPKAKNNKLVIIKAKPVKVKKAAPPKRAPVKTKKAAPPEPAPVVVKPPVKAPPKIHPARPKEIAPRAPIENIPRLAVGINYTGAQIRWRFSPRLALEGRYLKGSSTSDFGSVSADVMAGRLYFFLPPRDRFTFLPVPRGGPYR